MENNKTLKYKYSIGDNINNKIIIKQIIMEHRKDKSKGYEYHCLICGNKDIVSEGNLNSNKGCNVCAGKKILIGYNDMWTTNPNLAKLLYNKEDGYSHTENTSKKLDWKCSICGLKIINKPASNINRQGLSCPKCSDGLTYPEKIMFSFLNQLNIYFEYHKTFEWSNSFNSKKGSKQYDFYIPSLNCIIETHGKQHYELKFKGKTLQEEQDNDCYKEYLAKENGILNYIVINCKYSELAWIKENIYNSDLNKLFNLNNIDWLKCHEFSCGTLVKTASDMWKAGITSTNKIAKQMKLNRSTVCSYLKQGSSIGWCDYDSKKVMSNNGTTSGSNSGKMVVCLNSKEIFKSIKEAEGFYNVSAILNCCKGRLLWNGKNSSGEYLQWQYYKDYLINPKKLLSNSEIDSLNIVKKRVICLNSGRIFSSISEAKRYYNIKKHNTLLKNQITNMGKDSVTGENLKWMYYDDYISIHV